MNWKEWRVGLVEGKNACYKCRKSGRDRKGNNFHWYDEDRGGSCFSCGYTIPSKEFRDNVDVEYEQEWKIDVMAKEFTLKDFNELRKNCSSDPQGYRNLTKKTCDFYLVQHEYDEESGELLRQYYPNTKDYKFCGIKVREMPKTFHAMGDIGNDCELFGQWKFKNSNSKMVLITAGEVDCLSAYQMINSKSDYEDIPVVSPSNGESGSHKQLQKQYEWLNNFDKIILCYDNDEAGQKAIEKAVKVLPKNKVYIMKLSLKDTNEYLQKGKVKEYVNSFWKAEKHTPSGILGSASLMDKIKEYVQIEKIPLPPFMYKLQNLMAGGIPLGVIITIGSSSGCVDADTEFLTPYGWKKISEYREGDLVAQYMEDGTMEFVEPLQYYKIPCDNMTRVLNKSVDQVLSDEHQVAYYSTEKRHKLNKISFREVKRKHISLATGFRGFIPTVFNYSGKGINLTEGELRLQVAVMADGRIVKEGKDNYTQMRFTKERKYLRLLDICKRFNLKYSDRGVNNQGYYEVIVWPKLKDKKFDSKYYHCSKTQLEIICDEIMHWDGSIKYMTYSSVFKENADFVQFAFHATGRRASIYLDKRTEKYNNGVGSYEVRVHTSQKDLVSMRNSNKGKTSMEVFKTRDGFKYCFKVPSSNLVLRRSNKIFITGNSGKSTIVDEMSYFWYFNSPHKVGVVTLEADSAQYGINILSRHVNYKINLLETPQQKMEFLERDDVKAASDELFYDEKGDNRFYIVEERDGDLESIQELISNLIISCDCKVIVLDPVSDILEGCTNEQQQSFYKWMKGMVKSHLVTFINIAHVRKNSGGNKANSRGADLHEEDFFGSSSIFKSSACNLLFMRDKEAEDEFERNTTRMKATKIRWTGRTSPFAGEYYYDNDTHRIYDKDYYIENVAKTKPKPRKTSGKPTKFTKPASDDTISETETTKEA